MMKCNFAVKKIFWMYILPLLLEISYNKIVSLNTGTLRKSYEKFWIISTLNIPSNCKSGFIGRQVQIHKVSECRTFNFVVTSKHKLLFNYPSTIN